MSINLQMLRTCLFVVMLVAGYSLVSAQEYRSYSGVDNNVSHPEWNSKGNELSYITGQAYADGVSTPTGISRPNPRVISNILFDQVDILNNSKTLSDYIWVFGQFIDHDISIVEDDPSSFLPIIVPEGDLFFEENSFIPMARSLPMDGTGTSSANYRKVSNAITGWLDGSNIYGSDIRRANWLRTFIDGKLKTSIGNLPPFNTMNGEFDTRVDTEAPKMANPTNISEKYYVVGDVRGNENVLLTSFHALFLREHNRLSDLAKEANPSWTDEEIYQYARRMVGGILQSIVYNEWLHAMGIDLDAYEGYQDDVDPRISNVFSAAAFRWGHSLVGSEIVRLNNNGETLAAGNLLLKDAFFNPLAIVESQGIESLLKGMGTKMHQEMDCKVVSDIRNFLFGDPSDGGIDLASINIMRGRERGLLDFNGIREALGLEKYDSWDALVLDSEVSDIMESLYKDIDDIDPWVGMLAENHMPDALFGETIMQIMRQQFSALRNGDRFFFENDPDLLPGEKEEIRHTKLYDILKRNTSIKLMQENVFLAQAHDQIPGAKISVLEKNLDFRVFPNPVESVLYLKIYLDAPASLDVKIWDNTGKLLESIVKTGIRGRNLVKVGHLEASLPTGMYMLSISDGSELGYQSFIKH